MVDVEAAAESFQSPLIVEYEDGRNWIVMEEFVYASPRMTVRIERGFETDFASIPRFVWRLMTPTDKRIAKPAVVHDFLYRVPAFNISEGRHLTRKEADNELREAMACIGTIRFVRNAVYWAVRAGGRGAWAAHHGSAA